VQPESDHRVKELYGRAERLPDEERRLFLDRECGRDEGLRVAVEELLAAGVESASEAREAGEGAEIESLGDRSGRRIGHYRLVELAGAGASGSVYRARDERLDRWVALKLLPRSRPAYESTRRRFLREARAASQLDHQNVCPVYEVGEEDGYAFIAMALVEGQTARALTEHGPAPVETALHVVAAAARGLHAAHERGIVHRDVKPENIMVSSDSDADRPHVQVVDFGVARLGDQTDLTASGSVLGTIAYMAPERMSDSPADARSDVWSLGVVLYELLTGRKPFHGGNFAAVLHSIRHDAPKPLRALRPDAPAALQTIVSKALEKDPEKRYSSALELARDLAHAAQETSRPAPVRMAVAVAAAAAAGLVAFMWPGAQPAPDPVWIADQLTAYPGAERDPAFSPDGTLLAYSRTTNDGSGRAANLVVRNVDTGAEVWLTDGAGLDRGPAWSRDGRWIAFTRIADDGPQIMVVPASGGEPRAVSPAAARQWHVEWTPDSRSLLYSRPVDGTALAIWSLLIETGEARQLTEPPRGSKGDLFPRYSPDGSTLAFVRAAGPDHAIYLLRDGRLTALPEGGAGIYRGIAWSGDGRTIVFSRATRPQQPGLLWRVDADGRSPARPLSEGAIAGARPVIAANGGALVYERLFERTEIYGGRLDDPTTLSTPVLTSSTVEAAPRFSPDGRRIVFASARSGWVEIWTADADGSDARRLSHRRTRAGIADWSPDGSTVVFGAVGKRGQDIFLIDVDSGRETALVERRGSDLMPRYSPDGDEVYFTSNFTGRFEIWKAPVSGGEPEQVTQDGGYGAGISPDGRYLYYAKGLGRRRLLRVPIAGGPEEVVLRRLSEPDRMRWEPHADGLYFLNLPGPRRSSQWTLQLLPSDGGAVREAARLDGPAPAGVAPMDVSTDGRILISRRETSESDLMSIPNFR